MYTRMKWMMMTAALVLSAVPGMSQEGNFRRILRFHLKPDMVSEFMAAVEADKEAMKKMGHPRRQTWWQSTSGPTEILLVRYYKNYADMDESGLQLSSQVSLARARVMKCANSTETVIDELIPEASVIADRNAMPKYIRTLRSEVKPEKMLEYAAWVEKEIGPAVKKSGVKLFLNSRVRYGATANMYISAIGMDSMASFDEPLPLLKSMGKPAYDAAMAKRAAMVTHNEATIYRGLPNLNYIPEAK